MAYQIAFDLYESATQQFLQRVQTALKVSSPVPIPEVKKTETPVKEKKQEEKDDKDKEKEKEEEKERFEILISWVLNHIIKKN